MSEEDKPLTVEEQELVWKSMAESQSMPTSEDKHTVHTFLNNVATSRDTLKTGFLKEEEVGIPQHPTRALQEFSLIAKSIIGNDMISQYFKDESEIVTASSLSREGFLDKLAVTQTRQLADVTKPKQSPRGFFKKKESEVPNPA